MRNVESHNCASLNELRTQDCNSLTLDCNLNASLPGTTHFFSDPHTYSRPTFSNLVAKFDPQISHEHVANLLPFSLSGAVKSFTTDPLMPHTRPIEQSDSKSLFEHRDYYPITWSSNDGLSISEVAPSILLPTNSASKETVPMSELSTTRSMSRLSSQHVNIATTRADPSCRISYGTRAVLDIAGSDLRPVQPHRIEPTHQKLYKPIVVLRSALQKSHQPGIDSETGVPLDKQLIERFLSSARVSEQQNDQTNTGRSKKTDTDNKHVQKLSGQGKIDIKFAGENVNGMREKTKRDAILLGIKSRPII